VFACLRSFEQSSGIRWTKNRNAAPTSGGFVVEAVCNFCRIEPFGSTTVRLRVGWWPSWALLMLKLL
jgi:hypothetical protein